MKNESKNSHQKTETQDKKKLTQKQTIFQYLQDHVATASMVAAVTGVPQKCICRYKRDLEKIGRLWEIEKKLCKLTGFRAWYLSADPDKAPDQSQLNLFTEQQ